MELYFKTPLFIYYAFIQVTVFWLLFYTSYDKNGTSEVGFEIDESVILWKHSFFLELS